MNEEKTKQPESDSREDFNLPPRKHSLKSPHSNGSSPQEAERFPLWPTRDRQKSSEEATNLPRRHENTGEPLREAGGAQSQVNVNGSTSPKDPFPPSSSEAKENA